MISLRITYTITGFIGSFSDDINVKDPNNEQEIRQSLQVLIDENLKGTIYERENIKVGTILLMVDNSIRS